MEIFLKIDLRTLNSTSYEFFIAKFVFNRLQNFQEQIFGNYFNFLENFRVFFLNSFKGSPEKFVLEKLCAILKKLFECYTKDVGPQSKKREAKK